MGIDYATAVRKVQDRDQWRSMVSKVPDGYGTRDCLNNRITAVMCYLLSRLCLSEVINSHFHCSLH